MLEARKEVEVGHVYTIILLKIAFFFPEVLLCHGFDELSCFKTTWSHHKYSDDITAITIVWGEVPSTTCGSDDQCARRVSSLYACLSLVFSN